nr:hypothetical protein [Tanacetum cinerariifolium]
PGVDAPDRRTAHDLPVCRQQNASGFARRRRREGRAVARRDADEEDGHCGDLPPAQHIETGAGAPDLSVFAPQAGSHAAEPGLGDRHHIRANGARLRLPCRHCRLVQQTGAGMARVDHARDRFLRRGIGGSAGALRETRDLQHRSGKPIHQHRVHRRPPAGKDCDQHGRQGLLARQRLRRAPLALGEIRGGVSPRLRVGARSS